jgi:enoyl-CoA hydratase/carnithine racemase
MNLTDIAYEKNGAVAVLTFTREKKRNAVRRRTWLDLRAILSECAADDGVRAVVITGRGKAFSAGADLEEMGEILGGGVSLFDIRRGLLEIQDVTRMMTLLPTPIVAALNGYAVGAGAEIAIASDVRIAAENATFEFAEVKVGLFETNGVTYFLPRLVGQGRAMELMLTGRRIDAREAHDMGLVSGVVKQENLLDEAMDIARTMAENAPVPMALVKRCLVRSGEIGLEDAMTYETDAMMACAVTEDAKEGAMAFLERRKPKYSGK